MTGVLPGQSHLIAVALMGSRRIKPDFHSHCLEGIRIWWVIWGYKIIILATSVYRALNSSIYCEKGENITVKTRKRLGFYPLL